MVARVRPAFGKMKAHQFNEKDILRTPARTATVVMKKNQYASSNTKSPATMPMIRTIWPSGVSVCVQ